MPFKIYKDDEVVTEGESPLEIKGIGANKDVAKGTYQAVRVKDDKESEKVDIPAFKTLPIEVTGVKLEPATLSIDVDDTENVKATVSPSNATDKTISLKSSDESIATVNSSGKVTGIAKGEATITVTTTDGGKTATCKVTVKEPVVNVTGVTISPKTATLEEGEIKQLSATVAPSDADDKSVSYASKSTGVASVDNDGLVTAKVAGESEIVVTTDDGDKKDTCTVTVEEPVVDATGVTLSPKTSTGETESAGDKQLTAKIAPDDATNKDVSYSIDDAEGLTVSSSGKIEWTADTPAGEYTTTVTTDDGDFTDTHVLTLEEPEEEEPDPEEGE